MGPASHGGGFMWASSGACRKRAGTRIGCGMWDDRRCVRMVELFIMGADLLAMSAKLARRPPPAALRAPGGRWGVGVALAAGLGPLRDRRPGAPRRAAQDWAHAGRLSRAKRIKTAKTCR